MKAIVKYGFWMFIWTLIGALFGEFYMLDMESWLFVGGIIGFATLPVAAFFGADDITEGLSDMEDPVIEPFLIDDLRDVPTSFGGSTAR